MIISNYPNVSLNTANPPTELARRDASRRDLFEPVKDVVKTTPEKSLLSDDKSRQLGSSSSHVNLYDANGKETETQQAIDGNEERSREDGSKEGRNQQAAEQQTEQEKQQLKELSERDKEVKAHEQAHASVGGQHAGAPSYSYEIGPDGKQYATGGEVQIDVSQVAGDPQATIQKMQQVRSAALAPASPSSADIRIAAAALQTLNEAQAELISQGAELARKSSNPDLDQTESPEPDFSTVSYQQSETLAISNEMSIRRDVIAGHYHTAISPTNHPLVQLA